MGQNKKNKDLAQKLSSPNHLKFKTSLKTLKCAIKKNQKSLSRQILGNKTVKNVQSNNKKQKFIGLERLIKNRKRR